MSKSNGGFVKVAVYTVSVFVAGVVFSPDVKDKFTEVNNDVHAFYNRATGKTEQMWDKQTKDQALRMKRLKQAVKPNPSGDNR